jgi:hypothetical protein
LTDALGQLALSGLLFAEGALFHNPLLVVEIAYAIRAGHDAELATNAFGFVNLHRAVFALVGGLRGAYFDALGVSTMLALNWQIIVFDIWII